MNADPRVRMSLVRGKRNPITGALVVARSRARGYGRRRARCARRREDLKSDLLEAAGARCRPTRYPPGVSFVPLSKLTAAGKLVRPECLTSL